MPRAPRPIRERFWEKVQRGPGCWEWTAALNSNGYGAFAVRAGKVSRANRLAWEFCRGPIPDGAFVLHHCDNPKCVRPDHLYLGSQFDNMQDASRRGRVVGYPKGERHPHTSLSAEDVMRIRSADAKKSRSRKDLAKIYGLTVSSVAHIAQRRTWRHVK